MTRSKKATQAMRRYHAVKRVHEELHNGAFKTKLPMSPGMLKRLRKIGDRVEELLR